MKYILSALLLSVLASNAHADEFVRGYARHNGTYVQPHYQAEPDHTVTDNYSFQGNVNPHNGNVGTNPYAHNRTSPNYEGPAFR